MNEIFRCCNCPQESLSEGKASYVVRRDSFWYPTALCLVTKRLGSLVATGAHCEGNKRSGSLSVCTSPREKIPIPRFHSQKTRAERLPLAFLLPVMSLAGSDLCLTFRDDPRCADLRISFPTHLKPPELDSIINSRSHKSRIPYSVLGTWSRNNQCITCWGSRGCDRISISTRTNSRRKRCQPSCVSVGLQFSLTTPCWIRPGQNPK